MEISRVLVHNRTGNIGPGPTKIVSCVGSSFGGSNLRVRHIGRQRKLKMMQFLNDAVFEIMYTLKYDNLDHINTLFLAFRKYARIIFTMLFFMNL